jgi:hypothetical protein
MYKLKTIGAAALAAALAVIITPAIQAATCTVPGDYPTIQAAVNDASCSEIDVNPGSYTENVVVNRSVTINGAQAGNRFDNRAPGGESIVNGANPIGANSVFLINAASVTIDGFTIKNSVTTSGAIGVSVKVAGNDAMIVNNIFDTITTSDTSGNGTAQAVYLEAGPDGVIISDNEMKNVRSNRSAKGVTIGDAASTNPSVNVVVKGNSIHDITSDTRGGYGVSINNGNGTNANSGLEVRNNVINNITGGGWVHAIGLETDTPAVIVTDNTISNLNDLTPTVPSDSIAVWFEVNASYSTAQVHTNNFNVTAASYGVAVHPAIVGTASVNATCNWWNSPTGPTATSNPGGTGAQVSPRVTYLPWLTAPAPSDTCGGGLPQPTTAGQCKNGGWQTQFRADGSTFKNQGDCIQYVNTGK